MDDPCRERNFSGSHPLNSDTMFHVKRTIWIPPHWQKRRPQPILESRGLKSNREETRASGATPNGPNKSKKAVLRSWGVRPFFKSSMPSQGHLIVSHEAND